MNERKLCATLPSTTPGKLARNGGSIVTGSGTSITAGAKLSQFVALSLHKEDDDELGKRARGRRTSKCEKPKKIQYFVQPPSWLSRPQAYC